MSGINRKTYNLHLYTLVNPSHHKLFFIEELEKRAIPFQTVAVRSKFHLNDLRILNRVIKERAIHLIQTHDARSDVIGLLLSKVNRKPMVAFAHGWLNWSSSFSKERLYAALEMQAVKYGQKVIVASKFMEHDLRGRGIPKSRIYHIPYGIDIDRFHPNLDGQAVREALQIAADATLIGTVGRFHPWKGQKYFIDAARIVIQKFPRARFLIVGDAAFGEHARYGDRLKSFAADLGLADQLLFLGSRNDIPQVMNALDIFVLPSLREPFGIVAIEAQACGKPVIATQVGGIPETLRNGETGFLIQPAESRKLAEAIINLLENKTKMRQMGMAGRKRVEKLFSTKRMIEKTEQLYRMMTRADK